MKAFVIKNKEGKYPDDTQFQPFFTTKDIYKTTLYKNFEEAQKACRSEHYKPVEITIAENDLEQENKELKERIEELEGQFDYECECNKDFVACQKENEKLKQQLAEKDNEIKTLKKALELACENIKGLYCSNWCGKLDCENCNNKHKFEWDIETYIQEAKEKEDE